MRRDTFYLVSFILYSLSILCFTWIQVHYQLSRFENGSRKYAVDREGFGGGANPFHVIFVLHSKGKPSPTYRVDNILARDGMEEKPTYWIDPAQQGSLNKLLSPPSELNNYAPIRKIRITQISKDRELIHIIHGTAFLSASWYLVDKKQGIIPKYADTLGLDTICFLYFFQWFFTMTIVYMVVLIYENKRFTRKTALEHSVN